MIVQTTSGRREFDPQFAQSVTLTAENDDEARLLAHLAHQWREQGLTLSPDLVETLADVRQRGPVTAGDLHARNPGALRVTAFNNRLERLRDMGFLVRRKRVRQWEYTAVDSNHKETQPCS